MSQPDRQKAYLREGLIWGSFLLLVAAALVTVAVPELQEDAEDELDTAGEDDAGGAGTDNSSD